MTTKDTSTIQRMLGVIEGIGTSLDEKLQPLFHDCLETIDEILDRECDTE